MKKTTFTLMLVALAGIFSLIAQIPAGSPIPVEFKVSAPDGFKDSYPYGTQAISSTSVWAVDTVKRTFSAQIVWARTTAGDSLMCTAGAAASLQGKIALVRRGVCDFSTKILNAQTAGALAVVIVNHTLTGLEGGGLINMSAGAAGASVKIPGIFITRENGDALAVKINSGAVVTATFEVKPMSRPFHAYGYQTPVTGIVPLEDFGITFINGSSNAVATVDMLATIKDPKGATKILKQTVTNVPGVSTKEVWFTEAYTPAEVGEYTVTYTNSLTPDQIVKKFKITPFTYGLDNEVIDGAIAPSAQAFVDGGLNYDFGNFYYTGTKVQMATHVTFALANGKALYTGDKQADLFKIRIYDADPDGNFIVPGQAGTYDALNEKGGGAVIVGFQDFVLTPKDTAAYKLLTVALEGAARLDPNKIYLLMVQYNGLNAALGIPPQYVTAGADPLVGLGECVFLDRLYVGGWGGDYKGIIRMHLSGFTDSEEVLSKSKISISPNPTTELLTLQLSLEELAPEVKVNVIDFSGRMVQSHQLKNVKSGSYNFDVSQLNSGTYFLSVGTPEGFRSEKFVVVRN